MTEIKILKISENATFEKKQEDIGYDLTCTGVSSGNGVGSFHLMLGIASEIPRSHYFMLVPRSSFTKLPFVQNNSPGIIDPDYRGEWQMRVWYIFSEYQPLSMQSVQNYFLNKKICQAVLCKRQEASLVVADMLGNTNRGEGGFGSTGV